MGIHSITSQKNNVVDIILLTCNKISSTRQCIDALYSNTHEDMFSLTVWDNGSIDGTPGYLQKLADSKKNISLFLNSTNIGIIDARNAAHAVMSREEGRATYSMFIDNDQYVLGGWLESYLKYLGAYDIVGFEGWEMREDFYPIKRAKTGQDAYHYVGCGGSMIPYYVTDEIGVFDERFSPMYFEDPSFCFMALEKGYTMCWNPEKKIFHEPHRLLNSSDRVKYFNRNWDLFKKVWKDYKLINLAVEK